MRGKSWNKFGAKKMRVGGVVLDSKAEGARWKDLLLLERAGKIIGLKPHVPFEIVVNGHFVCQYIADAVYVDAETGERVVEDTKGILTPIFCLKAKLLEATTGIVVQVYQSPSTRNRRKRAVNKGRWLRVTPRPRSPKTSRGGGA